MARSKHLVFTEQLFVEAARPAALDPSRPSAWLSPILIDGTSSCSEAGPAVRVAHDFRHTSATPWIARWSRQDVLIAHQYSNAFAALPCRHRHFVETFWYASRTRLSLSQRSATCSAGMPTVTSPCRKHRKQPPFPSLIQRFFTETFMRRTQCQRPNRRRLPRHVPAISSSLSVPSPRPVDRLELSSVSALLILVFLTHASATGVTACADA